MKAPLTRRTFLAAATAAALPAPWSVAADKPVDVSAGLEEIRRRHGVPSLTAIGFTMAATVAEGATGLRHAKGTERVTLADKYHIGSMTKSMTAVMAARAVEKGRLKWDTTLGDVLDRYPLHEEAKRVTLWQLLRHRSGLERDIPDGLYERLKLSRIEPMEQRRQLARAMLAKPPKNAPESTYEYSNVGYTFAGHMLEVLARTPWEKLADDQIFDPLGLKSGGFGAPAKDPKILDQPWGHRSDGTPVQPGPQADNVPAIGPAGTVHLSVRDFARYAQWHLGEAAPKPALVTAASLQKLHGAGQEDGYYGGWNRAGRDWAGGQALNHTGSNTMFYAVAWLAPARGFGMVATCNQGGDAAEKACDAAASLLITRHLT